MFVVDWYNVYKANTLVTIEIIKTMKRMLLRLPVSVGEIDATPASTAATSGAAHSTAATSAAATSTAATSTAVTSTAANSTAATSLGCAYTWALGVRSGRCCRHCHVLLHRCSRGYLLLGP